MRHDIKIVASNFKLDKNAFQEFCRHPEVAKHFGLATEFGLTTVSTSASEMLAGLFKKKLAMTESDRNELNDLILTTRSTQNVIDNQVEYLKTYPEDATAHGVLTRYANYRQEEVAQFLERFGCSEALATAMF